MEPGASARRRGGPLLVLLIVFLGIALVAALFAAGYVRRRSATSPARTDAASSEERDTLAAEVSELAGQVESVRDLAFRRSVEPEVLTSEELAEEVRKAVREGEITAGLPHPAVLTAFGMLPEGADLRQELEDASAAGVVGFYDPEGERLVVESRDPSLTATAKLTLAHELDHALTDQHFDLERLLTGEEPEDELLARTALAEGDATLVMTRWTQEHLSVEEQLRAGFESFEGLLDVLSAEDVPAAVHDVLAFPYVAGPGFVEALYDHGGWDAVNEAYRDPPTTTEQILHPQKYLVREEAEPVRVRFSRPGYRRVADGQVGELLLAEMLSGERPSLPGVAPADPRVADAAAGWDGGAYAVLEGPEGTVVSVTIRFETSVDDAEFTAALARWVSFEHANAAPRVHPDGEVFYLGNRCLLHEPGGPRGSSVTVAPFNCDRL